MLIKCAICGNSDKPLFQFPSDSGVRAEWFEVLREICGTIAAKILWSSLFDTSNVNQVLMSIYMTISNYSCQKYGTLSF
jgi:hypothetical protein